METPKRNKGTNCTPKSKPRKEQKVKINHVQAFSSYSTKSEESAPNYSKTNLSTKRSRHKIDKKLKKQSEKSKEPYIDDFFKFSNASYFSGQAFGQIRRLLCKNGESDFFLNRSGKRSKSDLGIFRTKNQIRRNRRTLSSSSVLQTIIELSENEQSTTTVAQKPLDKYFESSSIYPRNLKEEATIKTSTTERKPKVSELKKIFETKKARKEEPLDFPISCKKCRQILRHLFVEDDAKMVARFCDVPKAITKDVLGGLIDNVFDKENRFGKCARKKRSHAVEIFSYKNYLILAFALSLLLYCFYVRLGETRCPKKGFIF